MKVPKYPDPKQVLLASCVSHTGGWPRQTFRPRDGKGTVSPSSEAHINPPLDPASLSTEPPPLPRHKSSLIDTRLGTCTPVNSLKRNTRLAQMSRFFFHPTRPPDVLEVSERPRAPTAPHPTLPRRNRSQVLRPLPLPALRIPRWSLRNSQPSSPCHCRDTAEANLVDGRRYVSRSFPAKCVAQLSRFLEQRKMIGDRGMFPSRLVRGGFPEADVCG